LTHILINFQIKNNNKGLHVTITKSIRVNKAIYQGDNYLIIYNYCSIKCHRYMI
jgi:hypothetical protein